MDPGLLKGVTVTSYLKPIPQETPHPTGSATEIISCILQDIPFGLALANSLIFCICLSPSLLATLLNHTVFVKPFAAKYEVLLKYKKLIAIKKYIDEWMNG